MHGLTTAQTHGYLWISLRIYGYLLEGGSLLESIGYLLDSIRIYELYMDSIWAKVQKDSTIWDAHPSKAFPEMVGNMY